LQDLAKRLNQCAQHTDITARLSSDEFVLVSCEHKTENDVIRVVHMLLSVLSTPFSCQDQDLKLHITMGISLYPKDGKSAEVLLKNADLALNRAKKMGADFRFYTNEMQKQMVERVTLEKQLRKALVNEEFFLNYHPIYNARTNKISGVEALLRWQHPKKGIVYPAGFIGVAEETGLITEIGEWVINEVLRQYQQWLQKKMQPIQVAINLSARQFSHHDLVAILNRTVKKYDIDPHSIDLEITESILMENTQHNSTALQKLKSLGFSLVIDDFGTGYSSLAYLKSFAIDKIKIAQPFVNSLHTDNGVAIVQAILAMAKQLQLGVIAEGVERKIEYDFLVENGCEEIQGFYFSKPLLEADFFNLMQEFSEIGRK
jgi:EAL domain-containing protein (putative c-di-GMP-specific phosphodiesterase class I)